MAKDGTKRGRPTTVTPEKLLKLEDAFKMGCSATEAYIHADIPRSTYYDYIKANPDFSDKIDDWREHPILEARKKVMMGIKEDHNLAFKYLSKKRSEEFKDGVQLTAKVEMADPKDIVDKLKKYDADKEAGGSDS